MSAPARLLSHDEVLVRLDADFDALPKKPRRQPWKPKGPPIACEHPHISKSPSAGLIDVVCLDCCHEWLEVKS